MRINNHFIDQERIYHAKKGSMDPDTLFIYVVLNGESKKIGIEMGSEEEVNEALEKIERKKSNQAPF